MAKYRKKPVVIEAVRWDGLNHQEVDDLALDAVRSFNPNGTITIKTLEGAIFASRGDWIIKGVAGEIYPCKPEIFEKTYDAVSDAHEGHSIVDAALAIFVLVLALYVLLRIT